MKYFQILLAIILVSCGSGSKQPSLDDANALLENVSKVDTSWWIFPKRHYAGGDGVFIVETDKDRERKRIQDAGEQAGVWRVVREQEGTGEFFFSVEKRNFYDRIEPVEGYEYLFSDNPNNVDEWKLLLAIKEKGLFTDIVMKKDSYSSQEPDFPIGFMDIKIEKTPLYDIFRPTSSMWSSYFIFEKVDGKWRIKGESTMKQDEKMSLLRR